jgi:phospholipid transport system substrate-binding protein
LRRASCRIALLVTLGFIGAVPPSGSIRARAAAQDVVRAEGDASAAQAFVRARHDELRTMLRRPARAAQIEQRRTQLNAALAELLDYDEIARRALGDHWGRATGSERDEFARLLRQLVERSYQRNLESTLDYDVRYLGAEAVGGGVTVRTVVKSRRNGREPEVAIDYVLRSAGSAWKVVDIVTDGVSLVRNYRSQFGRIAAREGMAGLLGRMRDRLARGDDGV